MKKRTLFLVPSLAVAGVAAFLLACSSDDSSGSGNGNQTTPDSGGNNANPDSGGGNNSNPDSSANPPNDANFNFDVSVSCTKPADCADAGEVCCGSISASGASSSCQASCTSGQGQLCNTPSDCPSGDTCNVIPIVNVGVCQAAAATDGGGGDANQPVNDDSGVKDAAVDDGG